MTLMFSTSHRQEIDEIYQFAADMGGAAYIFTGLNDAARQNSALININVLRACLKRNSKNIFIHLQPVSIRNIISST